MYILIIILARVVISLACWGRYVNPESMLNPNNKKIWGGWEPPPGASGAWEDWLIEFDRNKKIYGGYLSEQEIAAGVKHAGYGIKDWPEDWIGLFIFWFLVHSHTQLSRRSSMAPRAVRFGVRSR
jgi:hypothetical protein